MKSLWSLLLSPLLASQVCGQALAPPTASPTPSAPIVVIPEGSQPVDSGPGVFTPGEMNAASSRSASDTGGFSNFIGFVSDPVQNIDPRAINELYPIFGSTWTSSAGVLPGADAQIYGAGLTVALSDRLAVGLNQGGYATVQLSKTQLARLAALDPLGRHRDVEIGGDRSGWLNLGGFVQYTVIADEEDQFLLTGGLRWVAPSGSHEIFQGRGPARLAPYVTVGKGLGCYHFLGVAGYQFAAESGQPSTQVVYGNVHLDRQCFGWLYPLVEVNTAWHTTSVSIDQPLLGDFFDLDNFEASGNIVTLAVGANAVLRRDRLEVGAVYSTPLYSRHDFNFSGLLLRMVLRF